MIQKTTLITDFDNTLYDWFRMWSTSFGAMLDEIERLSGIDKSVLIPEIRAIHQQYRTSEFAFLIENIPSLRGKYPGQDLNIVFDEAIHAYRRARRESLKLYEGVEDTLAWLRSRRVMIVLYTDSLAFYTNDRVRRLGLDPLVDVIYSPPDHEVPASITRHTERDDYKLSHAQHRYLPEGEAKPNPAVLRDIVAGIGKRRDECIYLGDSLTKDVAMAQASGIDDVFAEYGASQYHEGYDLLRSVSHWTDAEVQRERAASPKSIVPSNTIRRFNEVKSFFN